MKTSINYLRITEDCVFATIYAKDRNDEEEKAIAYSGPCSSKEEATDKALEDWKRRSEAANEAL